MYMLHIAVMLVQRAVGMHDVTGRPFKVGSTNVCLYVPQRKHRHAHTR